jgi:hypothetical protein
MSKFIDKAPPAQITHFNFLRSDLFLGALYINGSWVTNHKVMIYKRDYLW